MREWERYIQQLLVSPIGYNVPFLSFQLSFTRAPRFSSRLQAPEIPNRRESLLWELDIYRSYGALNAPRISIAIKLMSLFLRTAQASCKTQHYFVSVILTRE